MSSEPWLPPFVHPCPAVDRPPAHAPRSRSVRRLWAVAAGGAAAAVVLVPWGSAFGLGRASDVVGALVVVAVLSRALPLVSHRRRDALLALLPPFGIYLVALAVWRLSSLPYRDWRPRDDELPRVRVVPGTPFHVLAAGHRPR